MIKYDLYEKWQVSIGRTTYQKRNLFTYSHLKVLNEIKGQNAK